MLGMVMGIDALGVVVDEPGVVDAVGTLLVGDGGDPICWAPGIRLSSGWENGMTGCPDSASFM